MNAPIHLPLFTCTVLNVRLTRTGCGAAHKRSTKGKLKAQTGIYSNASSPRCRDCAIGAAHARGEQPTSWPDGAPLVTDTRIVDATPPKRTPRVTAREAMITAPKSKPLAADREYVPKAASAAPRVPKPPLPVERRDERHHRGHPHVLVHNGLALTLRQWSERPEIVARGITLVALRARVKQGWPTRDALTQPIVVAMHTRDGETMSVWAWARRLGIDVRTVSSRIERGWTPERALTTPPHRRSA